MRARSGAVEAEEVEVDVVENLQAEGKGVADGGEGEEGDMAHAIPSWTQPVGKGPWDDVSSLSFRFSVFSFYVCAISFYSFCTCFISLGGC